MEFKELLINFWGILNLMEEANAEKLNINFYFKDRPVEVKIKLGQKERGT